MENIDYYSLNLCSPLYYMEVNNPFFKYSEEDGELVMAFDLPQAHNFEVDEESYLSSPLWIGKSIEAQMRSAIDSAKVFELPAGLYFFSQIRKNLDKKGCIDLAIEVQKEGLWQRKNLGERLFIRYLYEDLSPVTQILRELQS